jgi:hypothetical protein
VVYCENISLRSIFSRAHEPINKNGAEKSAPFFYLFIAFFAKLGN